MLTDLRYRIAAEQAEYILHCRRNMTADPAVVQPGSSRNPSRPGPLGLGRELLLQLQLELPGHSPVARVSEFKMC